MKTTLFLVCLLPLAVLAATVVDETKKAESEPKPVEKTEDVQPHSVTDEEKKGEAVVSEVASHDAAAEPKPAAAVVPEPEQQQQQQQHSSAVNADGEKEIQLTSQVREDSVARQNGNSQQGPTNRQNQGSPLFGNLLQPVLNPGQFLSNLLPGRNERRQIGETCQFSSECLAGTDNSVCFNGTCLCNLGYRYTADSKQCTAVDTCPTCPTDSCSSGTDVYCNGTCIRNMKAITIKGLGENGKMTLTSPNWPENYPAGTDVYYCISASVGRRVNVLLNWFDLETNCGYGCDYVRVYNGCVGKPSELIALFHGDNARSRECVTSTCNQMLVHFHSDPDKGKAGDQRSGFMGFIREATYTNDLCNQCSPTKN